MDRFITIRFQQAAMHKPRRNCKQNRCELCGINDCPYQDSYHYDINGCGSCRYVHNAYVHNANVGQRCTASFKFKKMMRKMVSLIKNY